MGLAWHEMLSNMWIKRFLKPQTLTDGSTINTYETAQVAASIDQWDADKFKFQKLLLIIDVASISAGTLTISLRDDEAALTNANGDANSTLVCTLTAISAAGTYIAEIPMNHVWASTTTRVTNDSGDHNVQRYLSVRAVASGGDSVFSALGVFGGNLGGIVSQDATDLTDDLTWAT